MGINRQKGRCDGSDHKTSETEERRRRKKRDGERDSIGEEEEEKVVNEPKVRFESYAWSGIIEDGVRAHNQLIFSLLA